MSIKAIDEWASPGDLSKINSHYDKNGTWGGLKAWIVHAMNAEGEDRIYLYRYVGPYSEVGNWPTDRGASKWEVVTRASEFVNGDCGLPRLIETILSYYFNKIVFKNEIEFKADSRSLHDKRE